MHLSDTACAAVLEGDYAVASVDRIPSRPFDREVRRHADRFDSIETLTGTIDERDDWHMTGQLAKHLERADPPIDGHDRLRLGRYGVR